MQVEVFKDKAKRAIDGISAAEDELMMEAYFAEIPVEQAINDIEAMRHAFSDKYRKMRNRIRRKMPLDYNDIAVLRYCCMVGKTQAQTIATIKKMREMRKETQGI